MIIIGDVHGCYKTLISLMSKLPYDKVCFVGDLIDRGPDSASVIKFVKNNKFDSVLGNHEDFAIDSKFSEDYELWMLNGGDKTIDSYAKLPDDIFAKDIEWMRNLPLTIEYEDLGLIISHSTAANYILSNKNQEFEEDILWDRTSFPKKIPGFFNVFGHTPQKNPLIKDHFANIDTGCVFKNRLGLGKLTALQFPEMKIFQQDNID